MKIHSLGRQSDLIFANFSGTVRDKGHYTLIQTPSNPNFHWGNFIIFDRPPKQGDIKCWTELFDQEFSYYETVHHYAFTWESEREDAGEYAEFIDAGFEFDTTVVLSTHELHAPWHPNPMIEIKKITTDAQWQAVIALQIRCGDEAFANGYAEFKNAQFTQYRQMVGAGKGHWFGAFIDDKLVGDLGIFHDGRLGRYQNVETSPDYRRQGICAALAYEAGQIALREYGIHHLVIEADPDYHATRIYESIGFKPKEQIFSLAWWQNSVGADRSQA